MQPIINMIKRTARLTEVLAGAPQVFTLTLTLLPDAGQEAKNLKLDQIRAKMKEEEARISRQVEEDDAAAEGLRPQIESKVSLMSFQQVKEALIRANEPVATWNSPEKLDEDLKRVFPDETNEADLREELVNQKIDEQLESRRGPSASQGGQNKELQRQVRKLMDDGENGTSVGVKFNGPEEVLAKLSQSMNNDFLDYIKSVANRKKPYDCTNDVAYIALSGIKFLNKITNSAGEVVARMPKSGGYKLTNPYVFDQDDFYVDEELPFMELTFQTSL